MMGVRFLPPHDSTEDSLPEDRGELAEVLDLRSRLPQIIAQNESQGTATDSLVEEQTLDEEQTDDAPQYSASEDGVKLLARKAQSSGELRRALLARDHSRDDVEVVIEEFIERLYLDDLGLARVLTEKLREHKRASRSQIRMKLRERLLPDHVIDEALGELDDDEEFALLHTVAQERAKRLGGLDRATAERRLLDFLARRGWSGERATRAAREALERGGSSKGSVRFH